MDYHFELKPMSEITKPLPRLVVYGEPGCGKTEFGASSDSPVVLATESGARGLKKDRFGDAVILPNDKPKFSSWEEMMSAMRFLATTDHDRKWLIIDTLDAAESLCREHVCREYYEDNRRKFASYGNGEISSADEFRRLLVGCDYLQDKKGMGIILISHATLHKTTNALGEDYSKFGANVSRRVWSEVVAWADQVAYVGFDVKTHTKDGEHKVKAFSSDNRTQMFFQKQPGLDAKRRAGYDMPDKIELGWSFYKQELDKNY